jgi:hypothetical protein
VVVPRKLALVQAIPLVEHNKILAVVAEPTSWVKCSDFEV